MYLYIIFILSLYCLYYLYIIFILNIFIFILSLYYLYTCFFYLYIIFIPIILSLYYLYIVFILSLFSNTFPFCSFFGTDEQNTSFSNLTKVLGLFLSFIWHFYFGKKRLCTIPALLRTPTSSIMTCQKLALFWWVKM